jgi:(p)ppGpp synthase/HD superfamily hydrolase
MANVSRRKRVRLAPSLEDALDLAIEAHRGQVYPSPDPEPFILHPLRVMLGVPSGVAQIVAVLHDVVEDTEVTLMALGERGFGKPVLDAVDCLSQRPGEAYDDYINRLAINPIARQVKLSDLRDNLANNRKLPPTPDNLARIDRYERAQRTLADPKLWV